jgi:hypothetical protein
LLTRKRSSDRRYQLEVIRMQPLRKRVGHPTYLSDC